MPQTKTKQQSQSPKKGSYLDPAEKLPNREQELRELSLDELRDRYFYTFAKQHDLNESLDEQGQKDELIAGILAGAPAPPSPNQPPEGAKLASEKKGDKKVKLKDGREQIISGSDQGKVVVRQVNIQFINGGVVEVPNTEQIQTYDPDQFQKMLDDKFFSDSGMRIEILHQP